MSGFHTYFEDETDRISRRTGCRVCGQRGLQVLLPASWEDGGAILWDRDDHWVTRFERKIRGSALDIYTRDTS